MNALRKGSQWFDFNNFQGCRETWHQFLDQSFFTQIFQNYRDLRCFSSCLLDFFISTSSICCFSIFVIAAFAIRLRLSDSASRLTSSFCNCSPSQSNPSNPSNSSSIGEVVQSVWEAPSNFLDFVFSWVDREKPWSFLQLMTSIFRKPDRPYFHPKHLLLIVLQSDWRRQFLKI